MKHFNSSILRPCLLTILTTAAHLKFRIEFITYDVHITTLVINNLEVDTHRDIYRETDRQTDGQTDGRTDRQTDRRTDKHTHTHTHIHTHTHTHTQTQ